ncbi:HEPN domain-containing protein [Pareuzebyella sediminis]|uniref:HEPN domain-containing protein n=1 Tax=Pareuzebyella sediminis TaxID=2607998 RepID=UPI0011EEFE78|nr:HEPN domain-containing protein [Pareuzebyella sediminis]
MGYTEFFPFGNKSVTVEFDCDECGTRVESEEIGIPSPNYAAEKASDSHNENEGYAVCGNCDKNFDVYVYAGYADGYVEVNDVDDDSIQVHEIEDDLDEYYEEQIEAILSSAYYDFYFIDEIQKLKELNDIDLEKEELQETLRRQIFSGAITCLEDYLSTTLIQQVLNNEEYFKKFVKTFRDIKNRKFDLSEIYDKLDSIRDIVKKELVDVIYHDLPKVKGMYHDTFGIDFPNIGDLMSAIKTRHDMVHRNGKNKEGVKIEITKELVVDVIDKVELFVKDIDEKITKAQHAV